MLLIDETMVALCMILVSISITSKCLITSASAQRQQEKKPKRKESLCHQETVGEVNALLRCLGVVLW